MKAAALGGHGGDPRGEKVVRGPLRTMAERKWLSAAQSLPVQCDVSSCVCVCVNDRDSQGSKARLGHAALWTSC